MHNLSSIYWIIATSFKLQQSNVYDYIEIIKIFKNVQKIV